MNEKLKTVNVSHTVIIEDGVMLENEFQEEMFLIGRSGEFYLLYNSLNEVLNKISLAEERVFRYCCMTCDQNNYVTFSKYLRKIASKNIRLAEQTISNALQNLVKVKLLIKLSERGGTYMVNPRYITKQGTKKRKLLLKYVLEEICPEC